jgi:hypothetical protein
VNITEIYVPLSFNFVNYTELKIINKQNFSRRFTEAVSEVKRNKTEF